MPTFLASGRIPKAYFRVSMIEINATDKLINLIGEPLLASALDFAVVTGERVALQTGRDWLAYNWPIANPDVFLI